MSYKTFLSVVKSSDPEAGNTWKHYGAKRYSPYKNRNNRSSALSLCLLFLNISEFNQIFVPGPLKPTGLFALSLFNNMQPKHWFKYLNLCKTLSFNKLT